MKRARKQLLEYLMFQVREAGCIIRRVEYQADNERGFQVIMLARFNIYEHIHILVIKCQQKKTSFPKIFDQRYGLNIHKFPTPNVDKEYSRICLSNNIFLLLFYILIFISYFIN